MPNVKSGIADKHYAPTATIGLGISKPKGKYRGADVKAFFVRKDLKQHGLQRRIEGPLLDAEDRCLIVEDVVTTGGSTLQAIDAVREAGHEIVGVVAILDRLAGGAEAIRQAVAAPYEPLATIDDVYPERPDRAA